MLVDFVQVFHFFIKQNQYEILWKLKSKTQEKKFKLLLNICHSTYENTILFISFFLRIQCTKEMRFIPFIVLFIVLFFFISLRFFPLLIFMISFFNFSLNASHVMNICLKPSLRVLCCLFIICTTRQVISKIWCVVIQFNNKYFLWHKAFNFQVLHSMTWNHIMWFALKSEGHVYYVKKNI